MENWQYDKFVELLRETNYLLQKILVEIEKQNPPETFNGPGPAKMTFAPPTILESSKS